MSSTTPAPALSWPAGRFGFSPVQRGRTASDPAWPPEERSRAPLARAAQRRLRRIQRTSPPSVLGALVLHLSSAAPTIFPVAGIRRATYLTLANGELQYIRNPRDTLPAHDRFLFLTRRTYSSPGTRECFSKLEMWGALLLILESLYYLVLLHRLICHVKSLDYL